MPIPEAFDPYGGTLPCASKISLTFLDHTTVVYCCLKNCLMDVIPVMTVSRTH